MIIMTKKMNKLNKGARLKKRHLHLLWKAKASKATNMSQNK